MRPVLVHSPARGARDRRSTPTASSSPPAGRRDRARRTARRGAAGSTAAGCSTSSFWMARRGPRRLAADLRAGQRPQLRARLRRRRRPRARSACSRLHAPLHVWEGGLVFYGGFAAAAARRLDLRAPAGVVVRRARRSVRAGAGDRARLRPARLLRRRLLLRQGDRRAPGASPSRAGSVAFDELRRAGAVPPGAAVTPPLHPTQLYEAAGELAIFGLLCALRPRLRRATGRVAARLRSASTRCCASRRDLPRRRRAALLVELATPRLAGWLGLPPGEPVLLSAGQIGSLVTAVAVVVALARRPRAPRTPAP